jgi:hypothetical protein
VPTAAAIKSTCRSLLMFRTKVLPPSSGSNVCRSQEQGGLLLSRSLFVINSALNMEVVCSSKTSLKLYRTIRGHVPEGNNTLYSIAFTTRISIASCVKFTLVE